MRLETKSRLVAEYGALSKKLKLELAGMRPFCKRKATRPHKAQSPLAASLFEKKQLKKKQLKKVVEDGFLSGKEAAAVGRLHAKALTLGKMKWPR